MMIHVHDTRDNWTRFQAEKGISFTGHLDCVWDKESQKVKVSVPNHLTEKYRLVPQIRAPEHGQDSFTRTRAENLIKALQEASDLSRATRDLTSTKVEHFDIATRRFQDILEPLDGLMRGVLTQMESDTLQLHDDTAVIVASDDSELLLSAEEGDGKRENE